MSHAWEVTSEDIEHVLRAHNSDLSNLSEIVDDFDTDGIEDAILNYDTMEDQVNCMHSEIEDILIKDGHIEGPKLFNCP